MAGNANLNKAGRDKKDEFYTQYSDIEAEMNAYVEFNPDIFRDKIILLPCDDPEWSNFTKYFASNFERFGLKKLISTSYVYCLEFEQLALFEKTSLFFDEDKHKARGKLFSITRKKGKTGRIDTDSIEFSGYLKGDGDFRSPEVCKLRDEADIIITNPPFSLFREFLAWIIEGRKQFAIIGNQNAITYKEVFPLIRDSKIWIGKYSGDMAFKVPDWYEPQEFRFWIDSTGQKWRSFGNITWFTNIDLNKRHIKLELLKEYAPEKYFKYDNSEIINVDKVSDIPLNYYEIMGVPITFISKYNPEQFEIIGMANSARFLGDIKVFTVINGKKLYNRILIRRKQDFYSK